MLDGVTGDNGGRRYTLGADKPVRSLSKGGYEARDFVAELRERSVTPHGAQTLSGRRSVIDRRTTRHLGYAVSMRVRKRIVEVFGWVKFPTDGLAYARMAFSKAKSHTTTMTKPPSSPRHKRPFQQPARRPLVGSMPDFPACAVR